MAAKEDKRLPLVFRGRFSAKGLWPARQKPPFSTKKPSPCLEMDAGFLIHIPLFIADEQPSVKNPHSPRYCLPGKEGRKLPQCSPPPTLQEGLSYHASTENKLQKQPFTTHTYMSYLI